MFEDTERRDVELKQRVRVHTLRPDDGGRQRSETDAGTHGDRRAERDTDKGSDGRRGSASEVLSLGDRRQSRVDLRRREREQQGLAPVQELPVGSARSEDSSKDTTARPADAQQQQQQPAKIQQQADGSISLQLPMPLDGSARTPHSQIQTHTQTQTQTQPELSDLSVTGGLPPSHKRQNSISHRRHAALPPLQDIKHQLQSHRSQSEAHLHTQPTTQTHVQTQVELQTGMDISACWDEFVAACCCIVVAGTTNVTGGESTQPTQTEMTIATQSQQQQQQQTSGDGLLSLTPTGLRVCVVLLCP